MTLRGNLICYSRFSHTREQFTCWPFGPSPHPAGPWHLRRLIPYSPWPFASRFPNQAHPQSTNKFVTDTLRMLKLVPACCAAEALPQDDPISFGLPNKPIQIRSEKGWKATLTLFLSSSVVSFSTASVILLCTESIRLPSCSVCAPASAGFH